LRESGRLLLAGLQDIAFNWQQDLRLLDESLPYQAFDIEKDAQARKAYEALGGGGIPFVDVNGTLIRDYAPEKIMAALK
jgi:hypothetical protein